jgi:cardiolipin synthase
MCVHAGHRARWLADGDATFAAMHALIAKARQSVCLETYMIRPGEPAESLRAALIEARERGVRVQVLYDAFGSEGLPPTFFLPLEAAGGEVRMFSPARRLRLAFRDHRKLLVCDARCAIVGGYNIGPEYTGDGVRTGWRDIALEIEGPIGATLAMSFEAMYLLAPISAHGIRKFRAVVRSMPTPNGPLRLLSSGPGWRRVLGPTLRFDLRRAQSVRCMAGYFLPPSRIRRALHRCAARGGEVLLLLAGKTDVPVARYAAEHLYSTMMEGGAQLFEYQPQVLHAKFILMDDIVYVGSCNLDRRSLDINFELLLRLEWPELAAQGRALFETALALSRPVAAERWEQRRRWWENLRSTVSYWLLTRIDPLLARRPLRSLD